MSPQEHSFRPRSRPSVSRSGFTLLELLVVVAIMGIVAAFATPSVVAILRGANITQGGRLIEGQLQAARQQALAANRTVEVRFYTFQNVGMAQSASFFQGIQSFVVASGSSTPLDKPYYVPSGIIMDSGSGSPTLSSLLSGSSQLGSTTGVLLGAASNGGQNYSYCSFQFRPDGSTSLSQTSPWFVTLHNATDGDNLSAAPANFYTIQIDPAYGHIHDFQP